MVDGTRSHTLTSVENLRKQILDRFGERPSVLLLNKSDLTGMWQLSQDKVESLRGDFEEIYRTSAKTGDDVETALTALAELIVNKDLQQAK